MCQKRSFWSAFTQNLIVFIVLVLANKIMSQEFEESSHNYCDPNPCLFDGICQSISDGYICICQNGTTGYNCENNIDDCKWNSTREDESLPNKCQLSDANATCIDLLKDYKCQCSDQFFGRYCDIPMEYFELLQLFPSKKRSKLLELAEILVEDPALFADATPFFINSMEEDRAKISWTREDLIVWAAFAAEAIDLSTELTEWNDPMLGNCFIFGQSGKLYDVADIGENYGFQALLNINESDFLPWIDTTSLNVYVQQRNTHVFANMPFYSAPPGFEVQLMLTERDVTRLADVYGICANQTEDVPTFYYPGTYTIVGCLQSCYQNQVHLVCGCTDPRFPGIANVSVCGLEEAVCVLNVTKVYGNPIDWDSCNCPEACAETFVDPLWYNSDFPSRHVQCWGKTGTGLANCQKAYNGQVKLSVFFKFNVVENYNETPSQTFNQWLFQFGGITGIIAGFCFISIIEFIFFLYRTFLTFCTNEAVTQDVKELQLADDDDIDFDEQPIVIVNRPQSGQ